METIRHEEYMKRMAELGLHRQSERQAARHGQPSTSLQLSMKSKPSTPSGQRPATVSSSTCKARS